MVSEASKLVDELIDGLMAWLTNKLVNGEGFETGFHQFSDSGQGGRGSGHDEWCQNFY